MSTLEFNRFTAIQSVHQDHAEVLEAMTGGATTQERDTWPVKASAALLLLNGEASDAQEKMLAVEAAAIGMTAEQLAEKVLAKSDAFHALVGALAGLRGATLGALSSATTEQEVASVMSNFEKALDSLGGG